MTSLKTASGEVVNTRCTRRVRGRNQMGNKRVLWLFGLTLFVAIAWAASQGIGAAAAAPTPQSSGNTIGHGSASGAQGAGATTSGQNGPATQGTGTPTAGAGATTPGAGNTVGKKAPLGPPPGCQPGQMRCFNAAMRRAAAERNRARTVGNANATAQGGTKK